MDDFFDFLGIPDMNSDGESDLTDYVHYAEAVQDDPREPSDPLDGDDIGDDEDFDLSDDCDRDDFSEDFGDDL